MLPCSLYLMIEMCAGSRHSGALPISIRSSHSQGRSHICVTMVMLIRWLMTIHQWRCLIGQPLRALQKVFINAACVPALPPYAPQEEEGASPLLSVCFSCLNRTPHPTPTPPSSLSLPVLSRCPTHSSRNNCRSSLPARPALVSPSDLTKAYFTWIIGQLAESLPAAHCRILSTSL